MNVRTIKLTALAGFTAAGLAAASMAFAAGTAPSSGSSSSSGGGSTGTTSKCAQFKAKSAERKKCIKGRRSAMNNEELYAAGYELAKAGDYADALEFLNAGTDKKDVRFLTMIGYSTRKLGKVDEGMGFYMQALALDPNSVTTREYLGEAYLQKKDLASAQGQLAEIQTRCGTTCESYTELKTEIGKFQSNL